MPAVSKRQFDFMEAIAEGRRKKAGLSREQAAEYIEGQTNYKKLPSRSPALKKKPKGRHGQY